MQTAFGHLQINVKAANIAFYRELFRFLGWQALVDTDGMVGVGDANGGSLWFIGESKDVANDYDGPGVNHIALRASSIADVDEAVTYLRQHNVAALFETPRHRPEFSGEGQTYYQVMFESPDRLLFEVVYTGPK